VCDNDLEELKEKQKDDAIEAEMRRAEEEEIRKKKEDDFKETQLGIYFALHSNIYVTYLLYFNELPESFQVAFNVMVPLCRYMLFLIMVISHSL